MSQNIPLQLMLARGVGNAFVRRFANFMLQCGEDEGERIANSAQDIVSVFGIKPNVAESIVDMQQDAESLLKRLADSGIGLVWIFDKCYPSRLKSVLGADSPSILFYRGNFDLCEKKTVGFCGSRNASEKGITVTEKCSRLISNQDIVVVSGYAHGVDIEAHRSALREGGKTIFVLAEGILHFHEKGEIKGLLDSNNHLVLSQFPPGLTWMGRNAMKRNSMIIGLSDAMILVESGVVGGTYGAGHECLHRHIPLFVVDFAKPSSPSADANSEFIRKGGLPIRGDRLGIPNLTQLYQKISKSDISHKPAKFMFDK